MLQGVLIGAVGTAAGAVLGLGLSFVLDRYQLVHIPTDVYQIAYIPFRIEPLDFVVVVVRGAGHLLPRDHLPVAPGGAPRSGGGAAAWLSGMPTRRFVEVTDLAKSYRTPNGRDRRAARPRR